MPAGRTIPISPTQSRMLPQISAEPSVVPQYSASLPRESPSTHDPTEDRDGDEHTQSPPNTPRSRLTLASPPLRPQSPRPARARPGPAGAPALGTQGSAPWEGEEDNPPSLVWRARIGESDSLPIPPSRLVELCHKSFSGNLLAEFCFIVLPIKPLDYQPDLLYSVSTMKQRNETAKRRPAKADRAPRCFGYARVSTERQSSEGHSLGDQEQRIRGYAQSVGLTIDGVFVEGGVSGSKRLSLRPKGAELLATLRPGDHVIATKLDRCFRSACDALNVAEDFRVQGIHLHLLDIGGDVTGDGVAKLVFNILAAVAEMERGRISERVRSVKQHLRQSGYFTGGHVARGFNVTEDGKLVEDARWQECLDGMKQMRSEGVTYRTIAANVSVQYGMTLDFSTCYRVLNGKRELDSVVAA